MRTMLAVLACLIPALTATAQNTPQTFQAGAGGTSVPFTPHPTNDSVRVAIRLPESVSGHMIFKVRAYFQESDNNPVSAETWAAKANFVWGLWTGNDDFPVAPTGDFTAVPLNLNPGLQLGGWYDSEVQWPALEGYTYWLIGYWVRDARFVRLSSCNINLETEILVGYTEFDENQWVDWNGGLRVEVTYGIPEEGTPSGIFVSPGQSRIGKGQTLRASFAGSELLLTFPASVYRYDLQVVNILGQTVVSTTGTADLGEARIHWGANHASGVYFCRVWADGQVQTVPIVNLK